MVIKTENPHGGSGLYWIRDGPLEKWWGVGDFPLVRIFFFGHCLCRNFFFRWNPLHNFFLDKYCFFLTVKYWFIIYLFVIYKLFYTHNRSKDTGHFLMQNLFKNVHTVREEEATWNGRLPCTFLQSLPFGIPLPQPIIMMPHSIHQHREGIQTVCTAYGTFYKNEPPIPTRLLEQALRLILQENSFQFTGKNYLQTHGTAMGTKIAVAFANIFMSKVRTDILSQSAFKPLVWKRYI